MGLGSKGFGNQYRFREDETEGYTGGKLPVDYEAHARSMGIDAAKVRTKDELNDAIGNAKDRDSSTLIEILVDPDVGVPSYESWWDVPVAEISTSSSVTEARLKYEKNILGEKDL